MAVLQAVMLALLWLVLAQVSSSAEDMVDKEAVIVLEKVNFERTMLANKRVFVQWYAPYCGECTRLMPELQKVAEELQKDGYKTKITKIDATVETDLSTIYQIGGPKLEYFIKNDNFVYEGAQTAEAIGAWLRERERPDIVKLKEEKDVKEFWNDVDDDEFAILVRVKKNSVRHKAFSQAAGFIADSLRGSEEVKFGVAWLPKNADAKKDATLTMRRAHFSAPDAEYVEFAGSWTEESITKWATRNAFPVSNLGKRFAPKYNFTLVDKLGWEGTVAVCADVESADDEDDDHEDEAFRPRVVEAVQPYLAKYPNWLFTLCDLNRLTDKEKDTLGVRSKAEPIISVVLGLKKLTYVLQGADQIKNQTVLEEFFADVKSGKVRPRYKSEASQTKVVDDNDGSIVLTGDSFADIVMDPKKDYFVNFGAEKCEHCKNLDPVWKDLGKELRKRGWDKKGVILAKIDIERNECEEDVRDYPHLVLYPAVDRNKKLKQRQSFSGGARTVEKLAEFLSWQAKNLEDEEESTGYQQKRRAKSKTKQDL